MYYITNGIKLTRVVAINETVLKLRKRYYKLSLRMTEPTK